MRASYIQRMPEWCKQNENITVSIAKTKKLTNFHISARFPLEFLESVSSGIKSNGLKQ